MFRRPTLALTVTAAIVVAACGGGDEPAAENDEVSNESSADDVEDDAGGTAPSDWTPVELDVRLPGGARVEADLSTLVVLAEPFGEPTLEVEWDGLAEVVDALDATGVHALSCFDAPSLVVHAQDADRIAYVSGSVCDGTPEADEVLDALAPIETALGVGLFELENARLPDPPPPVPDGSSVEYVAVAPPGADVEPVELTVEATEATARHEGGRSTIALSEHELAQLVEDLQTAGLPEPGSGCDGASSNSVVVVLGGEQVLSAEYLQCGDDGGFDQLVDVMEPTLDRFGLGVRP